MRKCLKAQTTSASVFELHSQLCTTRKSGLNGKFSHLEFFLLLFLLKIKSEAETHYHVSAQYEGELVHRGDWELTKTISPLALSLEQILELVMSDLHSAVLRWTISEPVAVRDIIIL